MELAKFIITCVLAALTVAGTIAGCWKAYSKKMNEKIQETEDAAQKAIAEVKKEAGEKVVAAEKKARDDDAKNQSILENRIEKLEVDMRKLQETINDDIRDRLGNIEGEMKGMGNILKSIQNWFIQNTPKG